jgi:CPA1 family monovalent cation:H+ antiporter
LTFSAIFVTLVLQGLTLPPLIRYLNLPVSDGDETRERRARRKMVSAALKRVQELRENDGPEFEAMYDTLARFYQQRLGLLAADSEEHDGREVSTHEGRMRYRSVAKQIRDAERSALMTLHARNEINDGVLLTLEHELDLLDLRASEV